MPDSRPRPRQLAGSRSLLVRASIELGFATFLGGMPTLILLLSGGAPDSIAALEAAAVNEYVLWYYAVFFGLHLVFATIERYWWFATPNAQSRVIGTRRILNEIGSGFVGAYRVLAGATLTLACAEWVVQQPILGVPPLVLVLISAVLLLGATFFSAIHSRATMGLL